MVVIVMVMVTVVVLVVVLIRVAVVVGGGRVRRACADDEGLLMTRASARGTGIRDGFWGGETQEGAGLCRKSKVFFWNQSECRGLSLSGKLSGAEGGNR